MSVSLKDFVGEWSSRGWNTHPQGDARAIYYPADGVKLQAVLADGSNFLMPGAASIREKVVRFVVLDKAQYPKLAALEKADYHMFGETLISTPIQVSATEWFTDIVEFLPPGTPVPGTNNVSNLGSMRHTLLWNDGVRAKWICCWNGY